MISSIDYFFQFYFHDLEHSLLKFEIVQQFIRDIQVDLVKRREFIFCEFYPKAEIISFDLANNLTLDTKYFHYAIKLMLNL